jgi:hypothetical protein
MKIELNDDWRIKTDPCNFTIEERSVVKEGKTKGEEKWTAVGHYTSLDNALNGFLKHSMLRSDVDSLEGLKSLISSVRDIVDNVRNGLKL